MNTLQSIRDTLEKSVTIPEERRTVFYKSSKGDYAEHDQFIGVTVPNIRKIARQFSDIPVTEVQELIQSSINEERLLALIILTNQYQKGNLEVKEKIYQFYFSNLKYVNNWNLVDTSAHLIIGAHLLDSDKKILFELSKSEIMWYRRIAIVSTWYFIRNHQLVWTFKIAKALINDHHDLIHKATGWMLREAGKRDANQLTNFLDQYATLMPRTMLRYAIEKLPKEKRKYYLSKEVM